MNDRNFSGNSYNTELPALYEFMDIINPHDFGDGADGGYAYAAKVMKTKMKA